MSHLVPGLLNILQLVRGYLIFLILSGTHRQQNLLNLVHEVMRILCSLRSYKYWRIYPCKIALHIHNVVGWWILPLNLLYVVLCHHTLACTVMAWSIYPKEVRSSLSVSLVGLTGMSTHAAGSWCGTWYPQQLLLLFPDQRSSLC